MNGLPKCSEMMVIKRLQVIMIAFCTMFIIFAVNRLGSHTSNEVQPVLASAYKVVLDGNEIGIIEDKNQVDDLFRNISYKVQRDLNKSMLINKNIKYYIEHTEPSNFTSLEELEVIIYESLLSRASDFKQMAYILKVNDLEIALENQEAVLSVLEEVQKKYDRRGQFSVELVSNKEEEETLIARVSKLDKIERDTNMVTATMSLSSDNDAEEVVEEIDEGSEIVEIDFVETVEVFSGYISMNDLKTIEEAIELITKEKEEEKIYEVQSGDSLSVIAYKNEMALQDLLKLNPNITEKSVLQIGQELVITVPEPELSVLTREKIVYTEDVRRGTEYVNNANKYKGHSQTINNGSDGVKEVTAIISKVNGYEDGKEVVEERIIQQPVSRVIEVGTKPLPFGSTGQYIRPIAGGRFTSGFGYRSGGFHYGVDFATAIGTPVRASDGGRVVFAGWQGAYGYVIFIDHGNGVETRYAHLNRILVRTGQIVSQHEKIAETGNTGRSTGPHIHFEIRFDGVAANPMNYIR
ncbi:murein DD-endopeptidase MepM/ murein hydrolase activator NlpD [Natranaerovirga pectinivora]|uniref:Murein DD-endopeptidase MepM/ murein hydrolase activator NlpD n=1 Tax=Natranaerovirga pectinivora TaxID=682400 RepID=A0A4R3MH79_9FIRM|nr:M23 family metallopeptidase [Natranaerovirga pectinivora]TCT12944.1 murein DD-endopeptidase MepM/ murein hydrolase activator NlpD [Natranaerovirga pectinivora]